MSAHLRESELIDLLDGALPAARRGHLDTCASCRMRAEELSAALDGAKPVEIPEPPPLFWEDFSARIRRAVAAEPLPRHPFLTVFAGPQLRWGAACAVAALAVVLIAWQAWTPAGPAPAPDAGSAAATASPPAGDPAGGAMPFDTFGDIEADEAWALVRTMADDLAPEEMDAAGLTPRPGTIEHMAASLSETERTELARLLQEAIRKTSESSS